MRVRLASSLAAVALAAGSPAVIAQTYAAPAVAEGPAPISDTENSANGANLQSGNTGAGATTSIVTDPANPATIYIGTTNGGIWRSSDGGKSFSPLTDHQSSLSIGALSIDPTSPAGSRTLIAGFGNFSNAIGVGGALNGLIVSHDGGADWAPLGAATLAGFNIDGVIARGATIIAASPDDKVGGLFRSADGGTSFARVTALDGRSTSIVADPSTPGRLYAVVIPANAAQTRVVVSNDNGATWSTVFAAAQSGGIISSATSTVRLAVGPTGALAVGVVNTIPTAGDQVQGLYLSANPTGGSAFKSLALPVAITADGFTFGLNPGGQAATNFAIAVDPNNPNLIYVSGDRQALSKSQETQDPVDEEGQEPDSIGAKLYTATVFKIALQPDGTSRFEAITDNLTGNQSAPHADTRGIAFTADGQLLLASDGGLYSRTAPNSPTGIWDSRSGSLGAIEAYQSAYDPLTRRIFVAAQDNGVSGQSAPGSLIYNNLNSGDGFNAAVDAKTLAGQGQSVVYLGVNSLDLQRIVVTPTAAVRGDMLALVVSVGGAAIPLDLYENPPAAGNPPGVASAPVPVSSPFVLNRLDSRLAAFGTMRVYTATFDPALFTGTPGEVQVPLTDLLGKNTVQFVALAFGARDNPGALIAGSGTTVYVSTAATPAPGSLVLAGGTVVGSINALVFDPDKSANFYAATGASIFGTANSGASFTDLRGNLPATFQNVSAAEFISSNGVRALFAGGANAVADAQSPVYVALAKSLTSWTPFSTGLPNAIVNQLTYTPEADLLLVSTFGRGAWAINDVTSYFSSALQLQFGFAGNDSAPGASQLTDGVNDVGQPFGRGLVKEGGGVLTFAVPATYTAATLLDAGTIRAAAANVFAPTSDHQVATGAVLDLGGFDQMVGSLAGGGKVALGAGNLTTGGSGASTSFMGSIAGSGGLSKIGAGAFTLAGNNSYTGPTTVAAGTLGLGGGSVLASAVTVQNAAVLAVTGAAPGVTPAQVAGVNAASGSTLALAPIVAGQPTLASTGPVTLSGGITVVPAAALLVPRSELVLVTGSSVTDNRALVTTIGPLRAVADPTSTSFSVLLVGGERDLAQGPVQTAVATAIDADVLAGRDARLSRSLFAGTVAAQRVDLRALAGVGLSAFETAAVAGTRRFQDAVGAHIAGFDTNAGPAGRLALAVMGGPAGSSAKIDAVLHNPTVGTADTSRNIWIEGSGAFGDYAASGDVPAVHTSSGGVVLGAETDKIADVRLGIAAAYDRTAVESEQLRSSTLEGYRVAAYGRVGFGPRAPWLGASLDYSRTTGDSRRDIAIGLDGAFPLTGEARAHPDGDTVGGDIQVGQHFIVASIDVVPTVAVQALHYRQGAFAENGTTGAELALAARDRTAARTVLDAAASRSIDVGCAALTPAVSLGWAHEFADRGATFGAAFTAGGSGFRIDGVAPGRDAALVAASVSVRAARRIALYVGYDATLARGQTEQGITGGVRWTW